MKNRRTVSASRRPLGHQHLDRRAPLDALVLGEEHLAHAPVAKLGDGLEAAKPLAQHLRPTNVVTAAEPIKGKPDSSFMEIRQRPLRGSWITSPRRLEEARARRSVSAGARRSRPAARGPARRAGPCRSSRPGAAARPRARPCTRLATAYPSRSGKSMSSSTTSGSLRSISASAARPQSAVTTECPSSCRNSRTALRTSGLSSTTSTRAGALPSRRRRRRGEGDRLARALVGASPSSAGASTSGNVTTNSAPRPLPSLAALTLPP